MSESFTHNQIFIRKLTDIIIANLGNDNFGPKELAHESGMSLYRLNRRLNSINRKTTSQFIREVRLQTALELLQTEDYTVSEVAYKTGFSNPSYFISCFRDFFGYPPGKIRKVSPDSNDGNLPDSDDSKPEQNRPAWRTFFYTSAVILILTGFVYLGYALFSGNITADEDPIILNHGNSLAVLPFKNDSKDITDQYVYDGIMEEIFNSLTKIHELRVISRTSVEQYRNTTKPISEIGKNLGVNYIVEGSGQKFGNTFRLRVQLIEVTSDKHIWAKSYQQRMKNTKKFFSIQNRIAQNIASELKATITQEEKKLMEKVPTVNIEAYNLYLKANSYLNDIKATHNDNSYRAAIRLYNESLKTDTAFAKAYTGLAFAYWSRYYYETYFEKNYLDSCLVLANKALSFDNKLDEAYFIKGEYYRVKGQSQEALDNYDKALESNPNYYQAYYWRGYLLAWVLGDYVKGLGNFHKALNLIRGTGRPVILKSLGVLYRDAGFIEKAKYYYNEAFILDSNKATYEGNLAFIEFCNENFEAALNLWKQQEETNSTSTGSQNYYFVTPGHNKEAYFQAVKDIENFKKSGALNLVRSHRVGYAFWQVGKKNEAEYYFKQQIKYCEESIKLSRDIDQRKAAQYDLAGTYAFLGEKVKAYEYLDECVKRNSFPLWWVTFIKYDLLFSGIRNEERFQQIVQRVETKYQAEHERVRKWLEEQQMM